MNDEKKEFSKEQVIIEKATPEDIEAINKYADEHPEHRHVIAMLIDITNMLKAVCARMGITQNPPPGKIMKPNMNIHINPKQLGKN